MPKNGAFPCAAWAGGSTSDAISYVDAAIPMAIEEQSLSKPATAADVSKGFAIFSLVEKGSPSVVRLKLPAQGYLKYGKAASDQAPGTVWLLKPWLGRRLHC